MNLIPIAREIFLNALRQAGIAEAIRDRVRCVDQTLHIGELAYPLRKFRQVKIVAIGKAAFPMCGALVPILDSALEPGQALQGVAVGADLPQGMDSRVELFRGGHPLPDHESLRAANAILRLLAGSDETTLVLFMISGGASAMVEKPLDERISFEDTGLFHAALVRSGLPITQMNAVRKHFSQVKGGRLAVAAQGATQCTLLVSDVPKDSLDTVGSGPSLPDTSTRQQSLDIIESSSERLQLPPSVLAFFHGPGLQETPKEDHPAFRTAAWISLLSSDDLCDSAERLAARAGFVVEVDNGCDDWDYRDAAGYLMDRLASLSRRHSKACVISVGEVSVKLQDRHGCGGRNQQFALECARRIAEEHRSITVLSGGSDGIDGNSPAAGAICDETTWDRASSHGQSVLAQLENFNSFPLFDALGDTIQTGPTGNNLRDLRILLSDTCAREDT